VPQTCQRISAVSMPKFTILSGHVQEVLPFNKFFCDCRYMPSFRRYSLTNLCDGAETAIFCVLYLQRAACSTFQTCILNSHYGHIMRRCMVDIQSATAEIRRGIKKDKKKPQGKNIMSASATQGGHNEPLATISLTPVDISLDMSDAAVIS